MSSLVSPIGGVVAHVRPHDDVGDGAAVVRVASAGRGRHPEHCPSLLGVAAGSSEAEASDDAVRDALLLYAAAAWDPAGLRWASADELGDDAIPVEELARVAPLETRDRIRWVEGFAFDDGRPVWIPAVLVHLGLPAAVEAESFWPSTTAGLHAAGDIGAAVVGGFLDCAARDALAVARIGQAPLRCVTASAEVNVYDATTDLGVPVAIARGARPLDIGVAAGATLAAAGANAVLALRRGRVRRALDAYPADPPPDPDFGLTGSTVSANGSVGTAGSASRIDTSKPALVSRLRGLGLVGYAVDVTTDELASVGIAAVRVVVPGLSPVPPEPGWADHARLSRVAP